MGTDLKRIGERARKEPGLVFTSLYHHIYDVDNLRACYHALGADKAAGVDGVITPLRIMGVGVATLSIAQHAFCSNGSTARASARHTPGTASTRHWNGWGGPKPESAKT